MSNRTFTLKNARLVTMSDKRPFASALVVEEGLIRRVGDWADVAPVARAPVHDLAGATVLPGFIETHMHAATLGMSLLSLDVAGAASVADIVRATRAQAQSLPGGQIIVATGLHPPALREARDPTLAELDEAAPDHALLIYNRGYHYALANSAGLEKARIPPALSAGVVRDEQGIPIGRLVGRALEHAYHTLVAAWFDQIDPAEIVRRVAQEAVARGVTTLHALDGGASSWAVEESDRSQDRLESGPPPQDAGLAGPGTEDHDSVVRALMETDVPVDIVVYYQTTDVDAALALGLPRIGGCILVDGGHEARTAAFLEPYADNPDNYGILYFSQEALDGFVWRAHSHGLQVAMHAIGDAAIEQALNAYEKALKRLPRADHRHRIEHFEFPTPGQVRRAAALNIALGVQPAFNHYWPHEHYIGSLGVERAARADPMRSLMEAGLKLGGGSDAPVTPLDPLLGIYAAVVYSRPEERLSIDQALRLFTRDAAWLSFDEKRKGSLEEGKQADMVVLSQNPLELPPSGLRDIQVVMTIHRGQIVYE